MTKAEFESRTSIEVSNGYYTNIIEPAYLEFAGDKDEFCSQWLESHKGKKKADIWEDYMVECDWAYGALHAEKRLRDADQKQIVNLLDEVKDLKAKLDAMQTRAKTAEGRLEGLLEDACKIASNETSAPLRNAIIKAADREYYISQKLSENLPLWDDERQWLIEYVKYAKAQADQNQAKEGGEE